MQQLATKIKDNLAVLTKEYDQRLQEIDDYAAMPDQARLTAAQSAIQLIAAGLEAGDNALFTQFIQALAIERMAQGFEIESVQQALTALGDIIEPLFTSIEAANFLWQATIQAYAILSQAALEKVRSTEEELRRLARAVEAAHDAALITDASGTIQFVNPAFEQITGYSREEALGQNPRLLKSGRQPEAFYAAMWRTIASGQVWQGDVTNRRKDGTLYEAQLTISPVCNEAGEVEQFVAIQRDVTAQKQLEQALREQQAFLRQVIDSNPNFVFVRDREGRFVLANEAVAEPYGTTPDQLIGKTDADFNPNQEQVTQAHLDDLQVMDSLQDKIISKEAITDAEGNVRWLQIIKRPLIDADNVSRRVLGVATDITELVRLENAIQESLERRSRQVQTSTEIAQEIAAAPALDELFQRVVTLIKERFGYYHAQIFRYDPASEAMRLVSGYGETGEQMLAAGHYLPMGRGVVGTAAATGRAVLVSDVSQDPDWVPNPFLLDSKGELAVPIVLRRGTGGEESEEVLGILDVQSDSAGALTADDQLLLEGLCGQIATAIDSTRLRQEMEERLHELATLYRVTTREAWQAVEPGASAYLFDPLAATVTPYEHTEEADITTVPLLLRGETIGSVGIYDDPRAPLSPEQTVLIQSVVEQAAQALESARLFEQANIRAEEQVVLNELSQALAATLNVDEVIERVYRGASRLLDTTNFYIGLYEPQRNEITFPFNVSESRIDREITIITADQGITGYIVRNCTSVIIGENMDQWLKEQGIAIVGQLAASFLGVPLTIGDQVLGVMAVQSFAIPHLYSEHDQELLTAIANQAAIAIQNARLFEEIEAALSETETLAQEQAVLNELGQALTALLDVDQVLEEAYRGVSHLMEAVNFFIGLYDPEREEIDFRLVVSESEADRQITIIPATHSMAGYMIRSRSSLLFEDNVRQRQEELGIKPVGQEPLSWLGVPLLIGDRVLGVMAVQSFTTPRLYDEHDQELLTAVASQVVIALQNARLFEQTQTALAESEALYQVGRAITGAQSTEQVLSAVLEYTRQLDVDRVLIALLDEPDAEPAEREVQVRAVWDRQGQESLFMGNRFTAEHIPFIGTLGPADRMVVADMAAADEVDERTRSTFQQLGVGGAAIIPLAVGDRLLGWLLVETIGRPYPTAERKVEALHSIAGQAAVAVQSLRQLREIQARAQHEQSLRQIVASISASEDLVADLSVVARQLRELAPAEVVSVTSYTPGDLECTYFVASTTTPTQQDMRLPLQGSGLEWAITHKEPWLEADIRKGQNFTEDEQLVTRGVVARLILPLQIGERVLGTLNLGHSRPGAFTPEHLPLLSQVAEQMALALERARLLQETQAALEEVEATHRRYLLGEWEEWLGATPDRVWGYHDSPDGLAAAGEAWTPEIERALASGELVITTEPARPPGGRTDQPTRNALAVPIQLSGQTIGVLDFYDEERIWTEEDKALVQTLADQVALALENQRLFEQTQRRAQRERLTGEIVSKIRAAGDVQSILETATEELGRTLGVSRALIRLTTPPDERGKGAPDDNDRG